jgi:hypothetical protein
MTMLLTEHTICAAPIRVHLNLKPDAAKARLAKFTQACAAMQRNANLDLKTMKRQ